VELVLGVSLVIHPSGKSPMSLPSKRGRYSENHR
jgi:hypothetical protein